jgi:threonine dehydrogenase-like Zn-dependent dehydrogenase
MAHRAALERPVACLVLDPERRGPAWRERFRPPGDGGILVEPVAVGLDATDEEVAREGARLPAGQRDLVLGHEALLLLADGSLAVPVVRRGCAACQPCRTERADLCETGRYLEHGIRGLDGWMAEQALARREELVPVPAGMGLEAVLAEPLSISVKGLEHAEAVRAARRGEGFGRGARALVIGLGSLGATGLLLLRHRGFALSALTRHPEPEVEDFCRRAGVALLGDEPPGDAFDLVLETPGSGQAIAAGTRALARNGVLVTLGTPSKGTREELPTGRILRELVTENQSILGSVSSSGDHVARALEVLRATAGSDPGLLRQLLVHAFPPEQAAEALAADAPLKKLVVWEERVPS